MEPSQEQLHPPSALRLGRGEEGKGVYRIYYSLRLFGLELRVEGRLLGEEETLSRDMATTKALTVVPIPFRVSSEFPDSRVRGKFLLKVKWEAGAGDVGEIAGEYIPRSQLLRTLRLRTPGGYLLEMGRVLRGEDFDTRPIVMVVG